MTRLRTSASFANGGRANSGPKLQSPAFAGPILFSMLTLKPAVMVPLRSSSRTTLPSQKQQSQRRASTKDDGASTTGTSSRKTDRDKSGLRSSSGRELTFGVREVMQYFH